MSLEQALAVAEEWRVHADFVVDGSAEWALVMLADERDQLRAEVRAVHSANARLAAEAGAYRDRVTALEAERSDSTTAEPVVAVVRHRAPSGNRDNDYFQAICTCGWKGGSYSNRTAEGRRLAERDARQHTRHEKATLLAASEIPARPDGLPVLFAIDADCPACGKPERAYDPARQVYLCSGIGGGPCGYESTERNR